MSCPAPRLAASVLGLLYSNRGVNPSVTAYAVPPFHSSTWSPRFVRKAHLRCSLFHWVFVPACASLARYSGAAERFALSSPLHPFGASTTTACFRHWRRPSCAPFPFGKKEAFGRATSYDCATNQKAPLDSKGAHEARALCAEQREVSPMKQGVPQASLRASEAAKRLESRGHGAKRSPQGRNTAQALAQGGAKVWDDHAELWNAVGVSRLRG